MNLPLAEVGFAEATWVLLVKSVIIFALVFAIVPVLTVVERKILGPLPGTLRAQPRRPDGARAAACRRAEAGRQGGVQARQRDRLPVGDRAGDRRLHGRRDACDPALGQRAGGRQRRGRPVRDRRLDRRPLLLRLRLDRLLRPAARRLGLGLQVLVPGRDALGRAAHLVRDLDGPRAARRGDDGRLACRSPRSSRRRATSGTSSPSSSAS